MAMDLEHAGHRNDAVSALLHRVVDGSLAWLERQAEAIGGCQHPVRLGFETYRNDQLVTTSRTTPDGLVYKRCGNRRASRCEPCSFLYKGDQFKVATTGMLGGLHVPETVATHPLFFVTLTAPSFGTVHGVRDNGGHCCKVGAPKHNRPGKRCPHGRPTFCLRRHGPDDVDLAQPLCPDCYDYDAAVLFNWHVGELWKRFQTTLPRQLARRLGLSNAGFRRAARITFYKVYEFQARGVVHAHAIVRFDAPPEPGDDRPPEERPYEPPLVDIPADVVRAAVEDTVATVTAAVPAGPGVAQELRWGQQSYTLPITGPDAPDADPRHLAGYLAKYTSKSAADDFGIPFQPDRRRLRRVRPELLRAHGVSAHVVRMVETANRLSETTADLVPIAWAAHQLGFRCHYASKSRRYSVTLGHLRRRRMLYQRQRARELRGLPPDDAGDVDPTDDDVVTLWTFAGTGWLTKGDAALADSIAARTREGRQLAREAA